MNLDINIFDIDWAKKGNAGVKAWGHDVFISIANRGKRHKGNVYISFRNDKFPRTIKYVQIARLGNLLLFKESDERHGWKMQEGTSLMNSCAVHISPRVLGDDIVEAVKTHNQEGFDLHYDAKNKIYYIELDKGATK